MKQAMSPVYIETLIMTNDDEGFEQLANIIKDHVRNSIQFAYILKACSLKNTKVMTVSNSFSESLMSFALNKLNYV